MDRDPSHAHGQMLRDEFIRRGMRLPQLRLLVALKDTGQVSSAAAQVAMSQPAASRLLTELERTVDARLYERHARGITLTAAGQTLAARAREVLHGLDRAQAEQRRRRDRPPGVSPGPDLEHRRATGDGAGAQLGTRQIHEDTHPPPGTARLLTYPSGHGDPGGGIVVGTVDAGDVHAAVHKTRHQGIVDRRLARQRHHDAPRPRLVRRTEKTVRVAHQQRRAALGADRLFGAVVAPPAAGHQVQQAQHLVQTRQCMGLGTTE